MAMDAMNVEVEPDAEERKGGSGHIGKMIFSASNDQLAVVAHVPKELVEKINCKEWVESVVAFINEPDATEVLPGICETKGAFVVKGKPGITFPIKLKDTGLAGAFTYLRSKKCFPESESEDDYCFGDDYGMVRDRAARGAVGVRECTSVHASACRAPPETAPARSCRAPTDGACRARHRLTAPCHRPRERVRSRSKLLGVLHAHTVKKKNRLSCMAARDPGGAPPGAPRYGTFTVIRVFVGSSFG